MVKRNRQWSIFFFNPYFFFRQPPPARHALPHFHYFVPDFFHTSFMCFIAVKQKSPSPFNSYTKAWHQVRFYRFILWYYRCTVDLVFLNAIFFSNTLLSNEYMHTRTPWDDRFLFDWPMRCGELMAWLFSSSTSSLSVPFLWPCFVCVCVCTYCDIGTWS